MLPLCAIAQEAVIRVPFSVELPDGAAPLAASDLTVLIEDETKAQVVRVRSPQDDLLLIVVLDLVGDLALVDPARRSLVENFGKLPPKTQVALMRAQDGLQVMRDPTSDGDVLTKNVMEMPVSGRAGLLETIETAVQLADAISGKTGVRVGVLYVTDSDVRNYREDFTNPVINSSDSRDLSRRFPEGLVREKISKIKEALMGFQAPVSIVHLRYSSERLSEAYQSGLIELATVTGGSAVFCRSSAEIPEAISKTLDTIAAQYQVSVQLPPETPKTFNVNLASGDWPLSYRSLFVLR